MQNIFYNLCPYNVGELYRNNMNSIQKSFVAGILWLVTTVVLSAPHIPERLKQNGLIYCTNDSGAALNPQTVAAGTSMNVVAEQVYNKLFELKNNSAEVSPVLAKSYQVSADGKTITIELRRGVKFHRTPWFTPTRDFNADDVLFSFNRILEQNDVLPQLHLAQSNYRNPQYKIFYEKVRKSHFPYFDSINLKEKIKKITALSPYRVQIQLNAPDASILSHLASQYAIIFSQEYALQLNADDNLAQLEVFPVGTGPYQVKDYLSNQYVRLIRNEHYWQHRPAIQNIVVDLSSNAIGRLAKFFNDECQITAYPEVSQLGLLRFANERFQLASTDGMNLAFLAFNFEKSDVPDLVVRQSIAKSINRDRIIHHIYYDTATVANSVIPSVSWAMTENSYGFPYSYDPSVARAVLTPLNLTLNMWVVGEEQTYNPQPMAMAELIKFDLAKVGVKVNITYVTRNYLVQQLNAKTANYDLILTGWLASTLDPDTFLRPILSCSTQDSVTNLANWCFKPFDTMLDLALVDNQPALRAQDYDVAQKMIFEQLPIIPIANMKRVLLVNKRLKGMELTPFGNISFDKLFYKQEHYIKEEK